MAATVTKPAPAPRVPERPRRRTAAVDTTALRATTTEVLSRWPSAGLAVCVVRADGAQRFLGHGVADAWTRRPVTADTVFRVGSVTKTFTAVAVMQLWERGLVDLDAPATEFLRSFRIVPARADFRPVTVRHLLTHTSGIGYWRRLSDLLRPGLGAGDVAPASGAPPLPEYYRRGLPVEVEPGTKWVYSNHGFAALGQIVEDVTRRPFDAYLRAHVLDPLDMRHTDLVRSQRVLPRLATGHILGSAGLRAVSDRDVPTPAAGGLYSTAGDLAQYLAALLRTAAGEDGPILRAATLAEMFRPHFRLDPRETGAGLGFELGFEPGGDGGHRTVGHTGVVSGFLSAVSAAPDDGVGVVVLSNTGGLDGRGAPAQLASALLRQLLTLPPGSIRDDIAPLPESWASLCGWYAPEPGPVTNLFPRALMGAGVQVAVRDAGLHLLPLTPVPAMRRGFRLHPDDPDDARVFRIDFSDRGGPPPFRVVFTDGDGSADGTGPRLLLGGMALRKRPDHLDPRRWAVGIPVTVALSAAALAVRRAVRARPRVLRPRATA